MPYRTVTKTPVPCGRCNGAGRLEETVMNDKGEMIVIPTVCPGCGGSGRA